MGGGRSGWWVVAGWGGECDWEDSLDTEVRWHLQRLGGAGPGNTQAEGR